MILKASEKLKILATGKATFKELMELEKQAESEDNPPEPNPEPNPEPKPEPAPEPKPEPKPEPAPEPKPEPQPDEKDVRIKELEEQLKQAQANNVNSDNSGIVENSDTALLNIFKSFR